MCPASASSCGACWPSRAFARRAGVVAESARALPSVDGAPAVLAAIAGRRLAA